MNNNYKCIYHYLKQKYLWLSAWLCACASECARSCERERKYILLFIFKCIYNRMCSIKLIKNCIILRLSVCL